MKKHCILKDLIYMEDKTALYEVIKLHCLFVCSVKLSDEQGVDSLTEIVTE